MSLKQVSLVLLGPKRSALTGRFQEIETWVAALGRYDNNEFDEALKEFEKVADTSKILFNMGVIHATLGEHEKAVRPARRCCP